MDFILPYILTWRLPAALLLLVLAWLPVRKAKRLLRTGDIWNKGAVEEVFLSSLLVSVAGAVYIFAIVFLPVVWWLFGRRHLLDGRCFLASLTALLLVAIYYALFVFLGVIRFDWPDFLYL
jgi:hypothetical protein